MIEVRNEPAQTYQLNAFASVLGRYAVPEKEKDTIDELEGMLEEVIEDITVSDRPALPHTNPVLVQEAIGFDQKLENQLDTPAVSSLVQPSLRSKALKMLTNHKSACVALQANGQPVELIVTPSAIAQSYGLSNLWANPSKVIEDELRRWSQYGSHPELTPDLERPVSRKMTTDLMGDMWSYVVDAGMSMPVNTYMTEQPTDYHLYWAPLANSLDYATPSGYNLATQLSFDLPHNAVHLYHLSQAPLSLGCKRYWDNMAQRAYFEAVAVFSEYKEYQALNQPDSGFLESISSSLMPGQLSNEELRQWLLLDRGYEFKLRAARYAADVLMIQGAGFNETVNEISKTFNVPLGHAIKETKKYLPWTGLGAVYSFGYRKLEEEGVDNIVDAVIGSNGGVMNTWADFSARN